MKVRIVCSLHTWSTQALRRAVIPLSLPPPPSSLPAPWDPHSICWNKDPGKAAPGTEKDSLDLDPVGALIKIQSGK